MLVAHHANDMRVVIACWDLYNNISPNRERFLAGVLGAASERDARGLVRVALARYLRRKYESARRLAPENKDGPAPTPWVAYVRQCDIPATERRTDELLKEVVAQ
jgi:hypothetical protein